MRKLSIISMALVVTLTLPTITQANSSNNLMAGGEVAGIPTNGIGGKSAFNNTHTSQDTCETITESIGDTMKERMKSVLPQSEKDNVTTAVDESQAVNVTNQTASTGSLAISELFSNPFDYIKKAATKLYDAAIEKGKVFLKNAYAAAVQKVTSYVNNMYAKQLSKVSSKLGNIGGPLLSDTMGQFVPNITGHLSGCAASLSAECLQQVTDKIGQGASEAAERAMRNAESTIENETNRQIRNATDKVDDRVNGAVNGIFNK